MTEEVRLTVEEWAELNASKLAEHNKKILDGFLQQLLPTEDSENKDKLLSLAGRAMQGYLASGLHREAEASVISKCSLLQAKLLLEEFNKEG